MTLKGHEAAITHIGFSPGGKQLVSTSADKTARVWDMDHTGAGFGSPYYLAPQSSPNPLKVWEVATRRLIRRLSGHTGGTSVLLVPAAAGTVDDSSAGPSCLSGGSVLG